MAGFGRLIKAFCYLTGTICCLACCFCILFVLLCIIVKDIIEIVKNNFHFKEIIPTIAGSVITSHCGQGTLGVMFLKD